MEGENKLVLEIDAINKVNYCLVHNGIKIISSIKLINERSTRTIALIFVFFIDKLVIK